MESDFLKQQWIQRVNNWRSSGQSIAEWCRENDVVYHQFFYWRDRLTEADLGMAVKQSMLFVELPEELHEKAGVEIESKGMFIRLSRDFDAATLLRCLQVVGRL